MYFCFDKLIKSDIKAVNKALDICANNGDFPTVYQNDIKLGGEILEGYGFWDSTFYLELVNGKVLIVIEGQSQCQGYGFNCKGYFNGKGENVATVLTKGKRMGEYTKTDLAVYRTITLDKIELYIGEDEHADNFRDNVGDIFNYDIEED